MPQPTTVHAIEALLERLRDRDAVGVFACLDCEGEVAFASTANCPHCGAPNPRRRLEDHLERVLEQGEAIDTLQDGNPLQAQIEAMLLDDKKVRAIKRVREEMRLGLRDAKELVEHVQAGGHIEDIRHDRDQGEGSASTGGRGVVVREKPNRLFAWMFVSACIVGLMRLIFG